VAIALSRDASDRSVRATIVLAATLLIATLLPLFL
jgi:hypothetical protein